MTSRPFLFGVVVGVVGAWLLGRNGHVHIGGGIGGAKRPSGRNARYSGLGRFR